MSESVYLMCDVPLCHSCVWKIGVLTCSWWPLFHVPLSAAIRWLHLEKPTAVRVSKAGSTGESLHTSESFLLLSETSKRRGLTHSQKVVCVWRTNARLKLWVQILVGSRLSLSSPLGSIKWAPLCRITTTIQCAVVDIPHCYGRRWVA